MIQIGPAFASNEIPVFYASDDVFLPNTAVAAYSVIAHASPERLYDIILLHDGIAADRLESFCSMAEGHDNVSVRAFDISALFEGFSLYTANRPGFSYVAFFRLLIPWLLPDCDKSIYLDGDTITRTDVATLYDTDMGNCLVSAAFDTCGQSGYFKKSDSERRYRTETLQMRDPERYFNSGILLFNTDAFRKEFTPDFLLEKAASRRWKSHDQDVLNSLCNGRVFWLSCRWNAVEKLFDWELLPQRWIDVYFDSLRDPFIVHYSSFCKPWLWPRVSFGDEFWLLAAKTPFFGELIQYQCRPDKRIQYGFDENEEFYYKFRDGYVGLKYIIKFAWAWLLFKLKGREADEPE